MTKDIPAHIIVLGNEKGGTGKSTTAMHVAVSLLKLGKSVGVIDIDSRQRTLSRYIENRKLYCAEHGIDLLTPDHEVVTRSEANDRSGSQADERERFITALARMSHANDFVIIDSPGSDMYLARLAHSFADTLVTPINDSFGRSRRGRAGRTGQPARARAQPLCGNGVDGEEEPRHARPSFHRLGCHAQPLEQHGIPQQA